MDAQPVAGQTRLVRNAWRNVAFTPAAVVRPLSLTALQQTVRDAAGRGLHVKAVGGGHSMNHIFRTEGVLVDLSALNRVLDVDLDAGTAWVEGGITLGDAIVALDSRGLHFPSLGSWYSQSIAGAIATSTHGSSLTHGSLSDIVLAVEVLLADGSVRRIEREGDTLAAWRCHLGELGVVVKVKLQLVPVFWLACETATRPAAGAFDTLADAARAAEYVNVLYLPDLGEVVTRVLTRVDAEMPNAAAHAYRESFTRPTGLRHRITDVGLFLIGHAYQLLPRRLAKWYSGRVKAAFNADAGVVDKSYRVFLYDQYREPTENHFLRMIMNVEYAFDLADLGPLMHRLDALLRTQRERGRYLHYPRVHIRFAPRSERTLVGLNAERDTAFVGIYVVGSIRSDRQIPIAEEIEDLFEAFGGRPHWGKFRYRSEPSPMARYPAAARFEAVRSELDPGGLFREASDMFHDLDTMRRPPLGAMFRSVFDPDEYETPRVF